MRTSRFLMFLAVMVGLACTFSARAEEAATSKATGTISGKVLDTEGKAVKGADVYAYTDDGPVTHANGQKKRTIIAMAQTAEDGSYKLEAIPAGKVKVAASSKGGGEMGDGPGAVEVIAGKDTKLGDIKLGPLLFQ